MKLPEKFPEPVADILKKFSSDVNSNNHTVNPSNSSCHSCFASR